MTHGSLFSGIGGFDLAAQWMGWDNIFHCEINPFGQRVLHHYWPNAIQYTDITKTDFKPHANTIDILTGGFPCQPYSAAGQRKGKDDERHLWPQMCRAIAEIAPRFVVGENVRGITNWNEGMVFDEVCTDLENLGYQVAPFLIPASGVNAPHKRERIWFVAYAKSGGRRKQPQANSGGEDRRFDNNVEIRNATYTECVRLEHTSENRNIHTDTKALCEERNQSTQSIKADGRNGDTTNTNRSSSQRRNSKAEKKWKESSRRIESSRQHSSWEIFPTQYAICSGDDGIPRELDRITFSKWRKQSIMGYGNAIVPQVALQIFKAIELFNNQNFIL
jgi:DNA (cytosine-5)-methyltransferase 1